MQTQIPLINIRTEKDYKDYSTNKKVNVVCYKDDKEKTLQVIL